MVMSLDSLVGLVLFGVLVSFLFVSVRHGYDWFATFAAFEFHQGMLMGREGLFSCSFSAFSISLSRVAARRHSFCQALISQRHILSSLTHRRCSACISIGVASIMGISKVGSERIVVLTLEIQHFTCQTMPRQLARQYAR
jgi:hypothetical protein